MKELVKTVARVFAIWLATLACDVSQPLPPPQLPSSQRLSCNTNGCGEGICHPAIGGGTCAAPCVDDAGCNAIIPGYVCHPGVNNTCAPACNVDRDCSVYTDGATCAAGRCAVQLSASLAQVRVLNATHAFTTNVVRGGSEVIAPLAPYTLSPATLLWPGDADLAFGDFKYNGFTFVGGRKYLVVLAQTSLGYTAHVLQTSSEVDPAPGKAALNVLDAATELRSFGSEVLQVEIDGTTVVGSLSRGVIKLGAAFTPGAGVSQVRIGEFGDAPMISGEATFAPSRGYTIVIAHSAGKLRAERAPVARAFIIDDQGAMSSFVSSGLRVVNAALASSQLTIDGTLFGPGVRGQTARPDDIFDAIAPGPHHIKLLLDDVPMESDQNFAPGEVYSAFTGARSFPFLPTGATGPTQLELYAVTGAVFQESAPPSATFQLRTLNYCNADSVDITVDGATLATGIAYGASVMSSLPFMPAEVAFGGAGIAGATADLSGIDAGTLVCSDAKLLFVSELGR